MIVLDIFEVGYAPIFRVYFVESPLAAYVYASARALSWTLIRTTTIAGLIWPFGLNMLHH